MLDGGYAFVAHEGGGGLSDANSASRWGNALALAKVQGMDLHWKGIVMSRSMLLVVVVALVALYGSAAFALDPMGPPAAGLEQGQYSLGLEYSYTDMDIDRLLPSWSSGDPELDIEMNKVYFRYGYGITDAWEAFLRLGVADLDYSREARFTWEGDGTDFAVGGGVKATFYETDRLTLGALGQISWTNVDGDRQNDNDQQGDFETELIELQLAAGATYTPVERVSVYAGPFLHHIDGHHTTKDDGFGGDNTNTHSIETNSAFGGYAGVLVRILDNITVTAEYMTTGDADGAGVSAIWKF